MWITNGGVAHWYFVLARTADDSNSPPHKALSGFIVDADSPGVIKGKKASVVISAYFENSKKNRGDIIFWQHYSIQLGVLGYHYGLPIALWARRTCPL